LASRLRKIRRRLIVLSVVWIVLLLTMLSFLSTLETIFNSNPEGRTIESLSWTGYIISQNFNSKHGVTSVEASWTVAQVNNSVGDGFSSTWIGIGGQTDKTLIQVGTEQDSTSGQENCLAWYELLPSYSVPINGLIISPGDRMDASLNLVDSNLNVWNIQLRDNTNGQNFNLNVDYNSTLSSGEWIVERPAINGQISTLCDFGAVPFSNCHITVNKVQGSIDNFTYTKIKMTNQLNTPLATVSGLSTDGTSFTANYIASS
jgi:hypothetical protein